MSAPAPAPAASGEVFLLAAGIPRLAVRLKVGPGWAALGWLLVVSSPDSRPGPGGGRHGLTSHQDRRGNHTEQHFSGSCSSIYR